LACLVLELPYCNVYGDAKRPSGLFQMLDRKLRKRDALAFADFFEDSNDGQL
jgi:hypothetical protein